MQYTAEVISGRLLELPVEAEELHLEPGDQVEIRVVPKTPAQADPLKNGSAGDEVAERKPKQLRARGMLAGLVSSEEFMRRKQEDIDHEDRNWR